MYQLRQIPSEVKIKKLVRKILFGSHMHCPRCRSRNIYPSENRYRCRKCRRPFSLTSNSWLSNMKLPWQMWYLLLWCWLNHLPIEQTIKTTELSEPTIRNWFEAFRANIPDIYWLKPLSGVVQMDEAFFKNRVVVAAKEIGSKRVVLRVLDQKTVQKQHVSQFVVRHVAPGSILCTDGGSIYRGIGKIWPVEHKRDIHSKFEFGITSEIEGVFGNLRTFIRRKYHHVTCSKLADIVEEFEANFNHPELFENPDEYLRKSLTLVPTC